MEYDPSDNSNVSFYTGVEVLSLLLLYNFYTFSVYNKYLRFDKVI